MGVINIVIGAVEQIQLGGLATAPILGTVSGEENTVGALAGRTPAGPATFARISTHDLSGTIRAYTGGGNVRGIPWKLSARRLWRTSPSCNL